MLTFSIIIPTYNRKEKVQRTLRRTRELVPLSWEIVVVDDGSGDKTSEVLKDLSKELSFSLVVLGENRGVCAARNCGIRESVGEVLVFLDSDDQLTEIAPSYIEKSFNSSADIDILFGSCTTKAGRDVSGLRMRDRFLTFPEILGSESIGEFLPICRRSVFNDLNYEELLRGFESITWLKAARKGYRIFYASAVLRVYDDTGSDRLCNGNTLVGNPSRMADGYSAYLQEFGDDLALVNPKKFRSTALKLLIYRRLIPVANKSQKSVSKTWAMTKELVIAKIIIAMIPRSLVKLLLQLR